MAGNWTTASFRAEVSKAVASIEAGAVRDGAMQLWQLGFTTGDLGFAGGLWNLWGRITDEFTHPQGDEAEGTRLAQQSAAELRQALGDDEQERAYCDRWIYERLDII